MPAKKLSFPSFEGTALKECFQSFLDKCVIRNLSPETIVFYQNQFHSFLRSLDYEDCLMADITSKDVDNFILYLRKNHACNDITINSYLRGLRAFFYYAMENGYLSPFKVTIPKAEKKIKETYTDEELDKLLKKPNLKSVCFSYCYGEWVNLILNENM